MQVDQGRVLGRAAAGLVQALAIQAERGGGLGKQTRRLQQRVLADAADLRHRVGRAVPHRGLQFFKTLGVRRHIGGVQPALPQHQVQHAVEQHHIGAGLNGQMQVGTIGRVGAARVDHDDFQSRVSPSGILDAAEQHRVRIGRVGADDEQRGRMVDVVVAGRWRIGTQGLLVTGHGAAHAQARVGVDIVAADQALGQFVENVIVFSEQLAGHVKAHRIGSMVADDAGEFAGGVTQCRVPTHRLRCGSARHAPHRLQQARLQRDGRARRQMQRAALGTQASEVGRVLRVATHTRDLRAMALDDDAAADTAVGTGGLGFLHGCVLWRGLRRTRYAVLARQPAAPDRSRDRRARTPSGTPRPLPI